MFYYPRDHLDMGRSVFGHHVEIAEKQRVILFNFYKDFVSWFQLTNHMDKYKFAVLIIIVAAVVTVYQIFAKYNSKEPRIY